MPDGLQAEYETIACCKAKLAGSAAAPLDLARLQLPAAVRVGAAEALPRGPQVAAHGAAQPIEEVHHTRLLQGEGCAARWALFARA